MTFLRLHRSSDDKEIWVNIELVQAFNENGTETVLTLANGIVRVKESPFNIRQMLTGIADVKG